MGKGTSKDMACVWWQLSGCLWGPRDSEGRGMQENWWSGTVAARWGDRRGGVTATVAGRNQSFAHTPGTHSSGDRSVPAALPPRRSDKLSRITPYRGQQGHCNHHEHWHMCTHGFCSSDRQVTNSRLRGGWAHVAPTSVCVSATVAYCMWICMHYVHASADERNPPDYDFASLNVVPEVNNAYSNCFFE